MTDQERQDVLAMIAKAREKTESMSSEQARMKLVEEGLYDENGRLTVQYGGIATARA